MSPDPHSGVVGLVLHFRSAERTATCLRGLLQQGVDRVVVVDNSEDNGASQLRLKQMLGAHATGMCEFVGGRENLGFARGVNLGLDAIAASGRACVLLINSDAVLSAGSLDRMRASLARADIVVPRTHDAGAPSPVSSLVYYQPLLGLYLAHRRIGALRYPSGCCLLLRSETCALPLFDEDFFFYGEDVFLGHLAETLGVTIGEEPDAVVLHERASSSRNGSLFYEYHMARAHWLLGRKLAKTNAQAVLFTAARSVILGTRMVVRCIRWRSLTPAKALWMATADLIVGRTRSLTPPLAPSPT